jgi:small subunit ribosomal protein S13
VQFLGKQLKMVEKQNDNFKHIVRIANVDIPGDKQIRIALTKIKGVGTNMADVICKLSNVNRQKKTGNMSDEEITKLNEVINTPTDVPTWFYNRRNDYLSGEDTHVLTGTLNFVQDNDLKRLKKTKTLRGVRHQKRLPVRGQRTRSNFRKSKGKVVGVKKKGTPSKK